MADANIIVKIIDQTSGGLNGVQRQIDATERSVQRTNTAFGGLTRAVAGLAAAFGAREIIQFADNIQTLQNRLRLVTDSQEDLNNQFENLTTIANRSRADLGGIIDLYSKIILSTQDLGISTETAARVTESFGKLLAISGAETAAAEGAIRQFSQALASGAFRGDEFNSVVEAAPGILDILANKLGVSRGEVRGLAADGELTAQILIEALTESATTIDQQFGRTTTTIGQALTVLKNNFIALGTEATPAADALAQGILLIANNLETAIVFAGSFIAAFAAAKIAAAVTALGGLRAAILAVNVAIMANPIGLIATAIAAAATAIIMNWEDIKNAGANAFSGIANAYNTFEANLKRGWLSIRVAGLEVWTAIQTGYLQFENAILRGIEAMINTVVGGFKNFAAEIIAQFKAVAAAVQDPLNAFEAYETALAEARAEIEASTGSVVDFSGAVGENEQSINELNGRLEEERARLEAAADAIDSNNTQLEVYDDAILRAARGTEDLETEAAALTGTTEENTGATESNTDAREDNTSATERQAQALADAERAIDQNIAAIRTEIQQIGLSEVQRRQLAVIIENENKLREALGDTVEELTQEEIQQLTQLVRANEAATADFLRLSDERVQAIVEVVDEHDRMTREFEENERAQREAAEDTAREVERLAEQRADFLRDVNDSIYDYELDTMTAVERINAEKEEFIRQAEEQGLADHQSVMDRVLQYDDMIRREQTRILEEQQAEQARIEERAARTRERELERELREQERAREAHLREVERFTENSERETTRIRRAAMTETMRIEDEMQEYIMNARQMGLENHQSTLDRLAAYESEIADARISEQERANEELQRTFDDQVSKYGNLYNSLEDRLIGFLGVSKSKFEEYNELAELFLGVNVRDVIKNTFAQGTLAIENFRNGGESTLGGFNGFINSIFGGQSGGVLDIISSAFDGSIFENFFNAGKNILGNLGSVVSSLFGNMGSGLNNIISSISGAFGGSGGSGGIISGITNAVSSIGNILKPGQVLSTRQGGTGGLGSVVSAATSILGGGGGGSFISKAISGIGSFFGFDEGGYIPGGKAGIVGEFGPELVSGPASVTGRRDTSEMFGDVNVSFTINAVDAKGIDQLLVQRKGLIKNIVTDAVSQRGRTI